MWFFITICFSWTMLALKIGPSNSQRKKKSHILEIATFKYEVVWVRGWFTYDEMYFSIKFSEKELWQHERRLFSRINRCHSLFLWSSACSCELYDTKPFIRLIMPQSDVIIGLRGFKKCLGLPEKAILVKQFQNC